MVRKEEKRAMYQTKGEKKDNPNLEPIGEKKSLLEKNEDKRPTHSGYSKAKRKYEEKRRIMQTWSRLEKKNHCWRKTRTSDRHILVIA